MLLKEFKARTSSEALARVKQELGPDAAILETRREIGGVKVIAAAERPSVPRTRPAGRTTGDTMSSNAQIATSTRPPADWQRGSALDESLPYGRRIAWLRDDLLARGFTPYLAERLTAAASANLDEEFHAERGRVLDYVRDMVSLWIPTGRHGTPAGRLTVLVGPPGVGKTTTIAKLAARERLERGREVILASADNRRLGGAEQLEAFARVLDVPCLVVRERADLARAVDRAGAGGAVFLDTPGIRRGDSQAIDWLGRILRGVQRDEIELLLAADRDARGMSETLTRFQPLGPGCVGATRTDESVTHGALVSALAKARLPLRHVAIGPDIPDDIEDADAQRLALWALPRVETAR